MGNHLTPLSPDTLTRIEYGSISTDFHDNWYGGYAYTITYPNGYAASIVKFYGSFGARNDLWEIAVMKNGDLCYDTEITDDVLGNLDENDVIRVCEDIASLDDEGHVESEFYEPLDLEHRPYDTFNLIMDAIKRSFDDEESEDDESN